MEDSFQAVVDRLVAACGLANEKSLAEELGFKQPVFAMRKTRDSLPREQIDALIHARGLNPEWVYEGTGPQVREKSLARQIDRMDAINEKLGRFRLNERQRSYMAKLQLAFETKDELRLKDLLDKSDQLSGEEAAVVAGLRSAPPELAKAVRLLSDYAGRLATALAKPGVRPSPIPDPETARMKPGEKRRYAAAKAAKTA